MCFVSSAYRVLGIIIMLMTDLHAKKEPSSLKMLAFRYLSLGQLKMYPAVPDFAQSTKTARNRSNLGLLWRRTRGSNQSGRCKG